MQLETERSERLACPPCPGSHPLQRSHHRPEGSWCRRRVLVSQGIWVQREKEAAESKGGGEEWGERVTEKSPAMLSACPLRLWWPLLSSGRSICMLFLRESARKKRGLVGAGTCWPPAQRLMQTSCCRVARGCDSRALHHHNPVVLSSPRLPPWLYGWAPAVLTDPFHFSHRAPWDFSTYRTATELDSLNSRSRALAPPGFSRTRAPLLSL